MAWQPQEEPLRQLAGYLRDSLSGHDRNAQKYATLMLAQAKSSPDINNYLTFLIASRNPPSSLNINQDDFHTVRSSAAIMLKNNVKTFYNSIPTNSLDYIRSSILLGLQDPNLQIRSYAGNVITEIVRQGGILGWPQLLAELLALVGNERGNIGPETQDGAMSALLKICEDNRKALDRDYQGQRPLEHIIPRLLDFTRSPVPRVRASALATLNVFIPHQTQVLLAILDQLLPQLFRLAYDQSDEVRRNVCRSFVHLVDVRPDKVAPHMEGLVDYMVIQQRQTSDEDLALDAAEFWLCVGEHDQLRETLGPYLDKVVPVLLESMVYSDEDVVMLEGGGEDAEEEDRAEDMKPQFAKSKGARTINTSNGYQEVSTSGTNGSSNTASVNYTKLDDDDDLDEGEIEEYDEDGEGGNPEDRWNLRKCSAATLDVLASVFHGPVFEITLPYLMENLRHEEWPRREAAVLALGAVADGCMDVVVPHLPQLVPYLISLLSDPEPVVRQITCWSLGRYSEWAAHLTDPAAKRQFFEPMMEGILTKMLDNNKRVQEAAASAFANLEEKAMAKLTNYCEPIVQQFVKCFQKYKDRNMFILYDCVQTLAEHVGPALATDKLINLLMPALIERWSKVADQSRELFPLLECLSYVANAMDVKFAPFAGPIFTRCITIIHQNLQDYLVAVNNEAMDKPDKDFLVTSLDLLSAIIQALGNDSQRSKELVSTAQPGFFDLLTFCMEDPSNDVRQSSYALLGDCAIYVFEQLQPFLPKIMPVLIRQLDIDRVMDEEAETGFSVVNNACWSSGEISTNHGLEMSVFAEGLYQRLLAILVNPRVPTSVNENAAIALGRLGVGAFRDLAPHLQEFAVPFLAAMEKVGYTDEKAFAFQGFSRVVSTNPQAMEKCLIPFFEAIARYPDGRGHIHSQLLHDLFQKILVLYSTMIPNFDAFLSQLPVQSQQSLRRTYNF
ncbi:MAG: hypothetical protein M1835_003985 [Candelina submexicana]|nr:MAG: hypothetical protein M1835_003985 [Candelina submexicana]